MHHLFLVALVTLGFGLVFFAEPVLAQEPTRFTFSVPLPGIESTITIGGDTLGRYIQTIYTYGVYAGTLVAAVVIMIGGFLWLTAGGNVSQIGQAKAYIGGALTGVLLLLMSWTLLNAINPNLVRLKTLDIDSVKGIGGIDGLTALPGCGFYTDVPPERPGFTAQKSPGNCGAREGEESLDCYCYEPATGSVKCYFEQRPVTACNIDGTVHRGPQNCRAGDSFIEHSPDKACPPDTDCPRDDSGNILHHVIAAANQTCEEALTKSRQDAGFDPLPTCDNCR